MTAKDIEDNTMGLQAELKVVKTFADEKSAIMGELRAVIHGAYMVSREGDTVTASISEFEAALFLREGWR